MSVQPELKATVAPTPQKKDLIIEAVNRLESTVDNLCRLLIECKGEAAGENNKKTQPTTGSLMGIINQTPKEIHNQCDKIDSVVNEFNEMFF